MTGFRARAEQARSVRKQISRGKPRTTVGIADSSSSARLRHYAFLSPTLRFGRDSSKTNKFSIGLAKNSLPNARRSAPFSGRSLFTPVSKGISSPGGHRRDHGYAVSLAASA